MRGFLCPSDITGHTNEVDVLVGHFLHFCKYDYQTMTAVECIRHRVLSRSSLVKSSHHSFPVNKIIEFPKNAEPLKIAKIGEFERSNSVMIE